MNDQVSLICVCDKLHFSCSIQYNLSENSRLAHTETQSLGKYGRMRRVFLEQNKPMLFNDMVLTETLFPHLREVQRTCEKRIALLMTDLLGKNPAPDKATQQLAWVAHMNSLKAQAEESVLRELVYEEDIL